MVEGGAQRVAVVFGELGDDHLPNRDGRYVT